MRWNLAHDCKQSAQVPIDAETVDIDFGAGNFSGFATYLARPTIAVLKCDEI